MVKIVRFSRYKLRKETFSYTGKPIKKSQLCNFFVLDNLATPKARNELKATTRDSRTIRKC